MARAKKTTDAVDDKELNHNQDELSTKKATDEVEGCLVNVKLLKTVQIKPSSTPLKTGLHALKSNQAKELIDLGFAEEV